MTNVVRLKTAKSLAEDMGAAVSAFLSYCNSKNLSQETIGYYTRRLLSFTRFAPELAPSEVTPSVIRDFLAHEKDANSPATANHSLCALKVFLGFLCAEGFIETNPAASVEKQKVRKPVIGTLVPDQVEALLATCRKDFYGVRDRAILLLLLDTGLRASELCGIRLDDVLWAEQSFRVLGKGNKERMVPFGQGVRQALAQYMAARTEDLPTMSLFVTHYGDPLNRHRLRDVVKRRCKQAGIPACVRPSPHTLRHTCAVSYLRAGGDTFTLQRLLGHTSQEMTKRYCESLSAADVQAKHRQYSPVDNMKLSEQKTGRKRLK